MLKQLKHVESYKVIPGGGSSAAAASSTARGGGGARAPDDTAPRPSRGQKQQQLGLVHEEREGEDRQPLLPLWSNQPAAAGTQLLSHSASETSLPQLLMPATPQGYEARVRSAAKTI